jgi:hypothetical protein
MKRIVFLFLTLLVLSTSCQKSICEIPGMPDKVTIHNHTSVDVVVTKTNGGFTYSIPAHSKYEIQPVNGGIYTWTYNGKFNQVIAKNDCQCFVINIF